MQKSNIANYCLFLLVNAVLKFNELFEKTKPLRKQQDEVLAELKIKEEFLKEKNDELVIINDKLDSYRFMHKIAKNNTGFIQSYKLDYFLNCIQVYARAILETYPKQCQE